MRTVVALSALATVFACADTRVVEPETAATQGLASFDRAMDMPGAMEFFSQITFVGAVDPGELHVTPSGVIHRGDLVNEWAMTGDLTGPWYFVGDAHLNPRTGLGRTVGHGIWFDVQTSIWGLTGTFVCNNTGRVENYPTPDFIQYGHLSGCKGTGDFDGMRLWAAFSNENVPGLPIPGSPSVYDFHGVIW